MSQVLDFAIRLARCTGDLLMDFYRPGGLSVQIKADRSVVTEADLAADRYITQAIQTAYPADLILSEELQTHLPADPSGAVWIIDPLDGTTNFSLGLHIWGVSIARAVDGEPATAAIYFPFLKELYAAENGSGATLNGVRIQAQAPVKEKPAAFFACCGNTYKRYKVSVPYKARILGSTTYNFCAIARGAAVVGFEAKPKVWDLAAGWVLVREAGGVIEPYRDEKPFPLIPGYEYRDRSYPTLSAATAELVEKTRRMILPLQK